MTPDEVKAIRLALGMTQEQIARAIGIEGPAAKTTFRQWESGRRPINPTAAQCLRYLVKFGQL
jgi:transcriptional regulator with XRE-family HTH domain